MNEDFRDFLFGLGSDLRKISKRVITKHEAAAYIRKTCDIEGPALLFENIGEYPRWRIAGGLYAARRRITAALRTDNSHIIETYQKGLNSPIPPKQTSSAAFNEVSWSEKEVDLEKLPILWHAEKDPGRFITAGVQVARDPISGAIGLGIHRLQLKGRNRLGIAVSGQRRLLRYLLRSEELGKPLEVATALGVDPWTMIASQAKVKHNVDKYQIAGGLKGSPIELAKCGTVDLAVPACTEIVIEGIIKPGIREDEGPFGEFTGCYGGDVRKMPVIEVTRISMRKDPIYLAALTGMPPTENHFLAWPANSEVIYRQALAACPEVSGVNMLGNFSYTAVVAIKKRHDNEPRNVIASVLGGSTYTKFCYVVDDDVDIFDPHDIQWALETRVQPDRDVIVIPRMVGAVLDPSAPSSWSTAKMGIDATVPLNEDRAKYAKAIIPGVEKVEL